MWAQRWNIPAAAVDELRGEFGTISTEPNEAQGGESEAAIQNRLRLEAPRFGARLWRNNIGAGMMEDGTFVRWGLCNDSKQMNDKIKSADLVGIRPVVVTPAHVGATLGVFLAREVKHSGWKFTGNKHETAQLRFLELVAGLGGDAAFATSEGTI